jgi:signal transduction histidine kinase
MSIFRRFQVPSSSPPGPFDTDPSQAWLKSALNVALIEAMSAVENRERDLVIRTQSGEGDEVRVLVRNSGIGFDPLSAKRMFDAFHTTKPGGLGMGLSISRSIVESHRGRLWAVANEGPGATFQFTVLGCR